MLDELTQFSYNLFAKQFDEAQDCDCYKCVGEKYADDGHTVLNNMEHHTFLEPCGECDRPKTEYRDLGRKGRYICGWCDGILNEPEAAMLRRS